MSKVSKKFDPKLFEENDTKCRNKIREVLKTSKYALQDNPKKLGVDMMVFKDGEHIAYLELERKIAFKSLPFPFPNINLPSRKEKYCKLSKPTFFIMFSEDLNNYVVIKDLDILSSPLEVVKNRYVFDGEVFFKISLDKVSFNNIEQELDSL